MTVDGTDFQINEPKPFSSRWYSHKFKSAALRYEIAVSLAGEIVSIAGAFEAGAYPDLKIFRKGLRNALYHDERVIADCGYSDVKCVTPDDLHGRRKRIASRLRARHEIINGRIKNYGIMRHRFRHDVIKHRYCFRAVANIVNLSLRKCPPFKIYLPNDTQ